ncbi:tight junction-associated protein 1 isoform 2 [Pontoporia blainvillei]|uniref:Tight junction-associated protein 1 isoform 2 n=1 Tax=Pontoporia blainvillei TaxID=48723 RepID=A0ABX0S6Y2_PONBL|nr:tight junction-associated protein 1 isoform 2 [Pontoporia blainvillei]
MTSAAPAKKPYRKAPPEHRELRLEVPGSQLEQEEPPTDTERMKLQHSYTASQRTNQELEDKLHTLIKKAEMDRKTLDWEIVELTNKLLDARNTINKLEELNERYRLDCNLAVQLLKCNKSHFRNHKFADLPCELQDMVRKHLHTGQEATSPGPAPSLAPGAVVPTSVIARVLEKPESLLLNSAQSGSAGHPLAEDVFVHVDMSGSDLGDPASCPAPGSPVPQPNGECCSLGTVGGSPEEGMSLPAFEKLSPYPTPSPPHPLYPGRKVIEFSEDKVRIPRNSPLPNCTYATRQAISLSLVEEGKADSGFPREEEEEQLNLPISPEEERQSLLPSDGGTEGPGTPRTEGRAWALPSSSRPQRSPKRMGVHHLHRKDSLTQAQEQGNLLN